MRTETGVILAAGVGSRLDRHDSPKPLVKVGGKPLIIWNIEQLQEAGVKTIYIILGHRGEEIRKELINHPSITAKIKFLYQEKEDASKKGMLDSVLSIDNLIAGPFFLTMADLVIEHNPYHYFRSEEKKKAGSITLLVSLDKNQYETSGALSRVKVSNGEIVDIGLDLKDYNGNEVGIYSLDSECIQELRAVTGQATVEGKAITFTQALTILIKKGKVLTAELEEGEWYDVNTPSTHVRAELFARSVAGLVAVKVKKDLSELKEFNAFYRSKKLATSIIVETNSIKQISNHKIIPDSGANSTHYLLTDEVVDALYGNSVLQGFLDAGYDMRKLVVPAGEKSKSIREYTRLADEIFGQGMDKNSVVVSLGGGVVNNIAGFLVSTLYRGIGLVHIPTTTMAQVDAAIDFKQAINSTSGKNLLGSYYSASKILIDPSVVLTLDDRNIVNGFSESIKHALTQDEEFFNYLMEKSGHFRDVEFIEYVTKKTIDLKVPLLNGDVKDDYNEMLPQYGHSVGHAVEHLSSYDLLHGEAISVGMCVTAEIAHLMGICGEEIVDKHYEILGKYNLPTIVPKSMMASDVSNMIRFDKHHVEGVPHMALPVKIGKMFNTRGVYGIPVSHDFLRRAVEKNQKKA